MALDLPQRHRFEHAEARAGDSAERVPAPVLDQGAHAHAEFQRDLVSGHADAGHISDPGRDRHSADVLLPPVGAAGLRRHQRPAVRRLLGIISAQPASLVRARHGVSGVRAHVQSVLSRRLPRAARVQLGDRRHPSADDAAAQLHRLPAALGSTGVLGDHRGIEHCIGRSGDGRKDSLPAARRQRGQCQRAAAFLRAALHDSSAGGDVLRRHPFLADSQRWRPLLARQRTGDGAGQRRPAARHATAKEAQ